MAASLNTMRQLEKRFTSRTLQDDSSTLTLSHETEMNPQFPKHFLLVIIAALRTQTPHGIQRTRDLLGNPPPREKKYRGRQESWASPQITAQV